MIIDQEQLSLEFNDNIKFDFDLKKKNWFNIGGKTKIYFKASNLKDLINFLKKIENKEKIFILGGGSNTLITDKNYTSAISSNRSDTLSPSQADITVGILNNKNILTKSILYKDCVPTQLGDLNFQSIAGGESFLTFPASFRFTYFEIK